MYPTFEKAEHSEASASAVTQVLDMIDCTRQVHDSVCAFRTYIYCSTVAALAIGPALVPTFGVNWRCCNAPASPSLLTSGIARFSASDQLVSVQAIKAYLRSSFMHASIFRDFGHRQEPVYQSHKCSPTYAATCDSGLFRMIGFPHGAILASADLVEEGLEHLALERDLALLRVRGVLGDGLDEAHDALSALTRASAAGSFLP
ncbi:hypothetical protein NUW54_g377 [Trametes sanguinea]|uniref:Uncharacterized protein n=1 Tax=Trametes sanguinea TaxID=158606 RepID=A0ACC1QCD2_9APHY|nr:hypothetical protein NUW54_g377 [Trametes sanguinea]